MRDRRPAITGPNLALDRLAALLAGELARLARLADEVQDALAQCEFVAPPPAPVMRGLQGIDRIAQGLDDLRRLIAALPVEVIGTVQIPAAPLIAGIRQRDLGGRITPGPGSRPEAATVSPAAAARPGHARPEPAPGDITWL